MSGEAWLYLFAVIINAVNLFLQVFFTIMYSDLEWYGILGQKKAAAVSARRWRARRPATMARRFCNVTALLPALFSAHTV